MAHPTKEIKEKIVAAYHQGHSIAYLSKFFSVHRNSVRNWIDTSKKNPEFTRKKRPGSGRPPAFNKQKAKQLLAIISKPASKFGFETDFWTTARIQTVCQEKLNIYVSRMAIHRTLVKYNQSYKKPEKRYFEACQNTQDKWKDHDLKKIKGLIDNKKALLYFLDESSINLTPTIAKTWGPVGKKNSKSNE